MTRWLIVTLSCFALATTVVACEKEGDGDEEKSEESGPTADAWDDAAYEEGKDYTATLKYWMVGDCYDGDTKGKCAHFDDADNKRVIFWAGTEEGDSASWEQSKVYTVAFTYQPKPDNKLHKGNLNSVE